MQIKKCNICGTEMPISEYYARSGDKLRGCCKECHIEKQRYRRTGVCNAKYAEILTAQRGACAICKSTLNSSRYTKLAVDHDHLTGKVRGLLCTNCNTAIGLMKDSPLRLRAAASYLEERGSKDIV